jgi:hypothetical protein
MKKVPYNPLVPVMNASRKSKRIPNRNQRRAKDARKSWKNEEH